MKLRILFPVLSTLLIAPLIASAQGVIGGNQNGLGPGGYLPKPPTPAQDTRNRLVTSITTPGYEFDLVQIGTGPVQVIIDPVSPIIVPLRVSSAATTIPPEPLIPIIAPPGFWSTFSIVNNTVADRAFTFPWQYWADNKIVFRVYDSNDTIVWQSVQIPVDKPPLAQPVNLTLKSKSSWRLAIFVPFNPGGTLLADGQYRVEATVSGTPQFTASAPFEVKNITGGPVVIGPVVPVH